MSGPINEEKRYVKRKFFEYAMTSVWRKNVNDIALGAK